MYVPAGKVRVVGSFRSAEAFALLWLSCGPLAFRPTLFTARGAPPPLATALRRSPPWLAAGAASLSSRWPPALPSCPSVVVGGRGGVFFEGTVTVNSEVAREISIPCRCSTQSSSACAPGRGSSAEKTYAAGPSVFAFRIDRLLFV